ncbi:unnamed protein product [Rhizoctonia solani]|uniref:Uncharacterized protein n=1 Tax=Rhizoctonia solani TaxID=456999 RepID=A0A8H2X409_9AGAM|nr:unnamed protein product [Rhizoctonia solani]
MEGRRQYFDPVRDSQTEEQHHEPGQEIPIAMFSHPNEDVHMEYYPLAEELDRQETQQLPLLYPPEPSLEHSDQIRADETEDTTPKIEFSTQWNNRKEAVWDIIGPKKGTQPFVSSPAPQARGAPKIWAENIYDAQDALPYFTVGQTILASKIHREVSRSVLLTRNLHDICANWRAGTIGFTVQIRYKLQLNRPKKWKAPDSPGKLVNVDCKPMDPIQFRKLRACHEGGIPVRVLATGDFPSLPTFQSEPRKGETVYSIGSANWQNGIVVLGFFWVKKIMAKDLETGKCSGRSKWTFEFLSCDINQSSLPWWCPVYGDSEDSDLGGDIMRDDGGDEELEFGNTSKRRRIDSEIDPVLCEDIDMLDIAGQSEECNESKANATSNYPPLDPSSIDQLLRVSDSAPDRIYTPTEIHTPPGFIPNTGDSSASKITNETKYIFPDDLGLELEPAIGTDAYLSRAPKLRSSLLLGWHCSKCGRLNPRKKWSKEQLCPLCQTTSTLILPEWHRRAHTEAAGPIGTFFRLDDGGHQPKAGLHQIAARDEATGLTFVEYWLAEAPMPIIAELNRATLADRRKLRKKTVPSKTLEVPQLQPNITSSTDTPTQDPNPPTLTPVPFGLVSPGTSTQSIPVIVKDGIHPDGGKLIRQRDPGGSRAVFSENTRMLFMHITCPQYPAGLGLVDDIFSGFATDVQMERQENSTVYRTGQSALSCHYTYLAGYGTHIMHTSSPAVDWENVPACVYDAHALLVEHQSRTVFDDNKTIQEFNQCVCIMGNGAIGTSTFRITHRAEDGPVGYMVFGASCSIEILVGNGGNAKRTTKGGAARRAEILLAHGDALMTMPVEGDAPLEVRIKRTGLAVVSIARYVSPRPIPAKKSQVVSQKKRLPANKELPIPAKRDVTPAKRKIGASSVKHSKA